jgi:hypothetical protein
MIPIQLLDLLVDRFRTELDQYKLKDPKNPEDYKPIKIYSQHLPTKSKDNDSSIYPYLIIRLTDGEEGSDDDAALCQVLFIAGVFDRNDDNQGFRDAISIIEKIYQSLKRNPVIQNKFEFIHPIRWVYQDEGAGPYYFAGLETNWEVPKPIREDVEKLI